MIEQHPLDDFDLGDFFNCVEIYGLKGALALRQPELPAPREDALFASTHREFQAKIMRDFFSGKSYKSMKAIAREFKDQFEATKQEVVAYSPDDLERKLYKETTMKTLAEVAKRKLKEAIIKSGQSRPNSSDEIGHRQEADAWSHIGQIVHVAAELDDKT